MTLTQTTETVSPAAAAAAAVYKAASLVRLADANGDDATVTMTTVTMGALTVAKEAAAVVFIVNQYVAKTAVTVAASSAQQSMGRRTADRRQPVSSGDRDTVSPVIGELLEVHRRLRETEPRLSLMNTSTSPM